MQPAIFNELPLVMSAISVGALLVSAVTSKHRRAAGTRSAGEVSRTRLGADAVSYCQCTRDDCSMCPARWSL